MTVQVQEDFNTEETVQDNTQEMTTEDIKNSLISQMKEKQNKAKTENHDQNVIVEEEPHLNDSEGEEDNQEEQSSDADSQELENKNVLTFSLGEDDYDIDENAQMEIKADGKTVKMTVKEMRDAAAGGIAVRNRLRQLSEEKKKLNGSYKNFLEQSEKDPLKALKNIFTDIKKVDKNADINKFLKSLGKQAQSLAQMSSSERKAYESTQELEETREKLSQTERVSKIQEMKQDLINEMGLTDENIHKYGQILLSNPEIVSKIKNEEQFFDRIGSLHDEVLRQQAVMTAMHKFDKNVKNNDPLVFELSTLLANNPDFDEDDLNDIAEQVLRGVKKSKASKVLSKRQRSKVTLGSMTSRKKDYSKMSDFEILKSKILEKRK